MRVGVWKPSMRLFLYGSAVKLGLKGGGYVVNQSLSNSNTIIIISSGSARGSSATVFASLPALHLTVTISHCAKRPALPPSAMTGFGSCFKDPTASNKSKVKTVLKYSFGIGSPTSLSASGTPPHIKAS
jgi:predicted TIM-barrel enzyme